MPASTVRVASRSALSDSPEDKGVQVQLTGYVDVMEGDTHHQRHPRPGWGDLLARLPRTGQPGPVDNGARLLNGGEGLAREPRRGTIVCGRRTPAPSASWLAPKT